MAAHIQRIKDLLLVCVSLLVAASFLAVTAVRRGAAQRPQENRYVTDTLPPVISKVRNLKIIKATIEGLGTAEPFVVLKIRNNSDVGVIGYTVTNGGASVGMDGGLGLGEQEIVIKPHGTTTCKWAAASVEKDAPLILAAALYADGTEDGQDIVLEMMHDLRAREKAERDAQKGASQP